LTRQNERCHENGSDCLRLDRGGGDAGDASTCLLLTRLPSRRTMPGVQRSVPAILRSGALLWSTAILRSGAVLCSTAILPFAATIWSTILRLRLGHTNPAIIDGSYVPSRVIALSLCIDPMHLKNVLRQVQSDCSKLARGWLPFAAESMRQQFGSQMPQGAIHPVIQSPCQPAPRGRREHRGQSLLPF
jgi:hypothetical protein